MSSEPSYSGSAPWPRTSEPAICTGSADTDTASPSRLTDGGADAIDAGLNATANPVS